MSIDRDENIAEGSGEHILFATGAQDIVVPSSLSLFDADFARDGRDLVLESQGANGVRIVDYFAQSDHADLKSPDGAVLRGELVDILAGPRAPGQYAQAGSTPSAAPIGQVETLDGAATVQRTDGVTETLQKTTKIFQNDVVQTEDGGKLSITFVDGTVFTLNANSRMVINELIYAPASEDNSATFNLIQGGFVFIAGKVASSGGMDINTPAATMGIRGTTVLADVQTKDGVSTAEITLARDPDGDVGKVALFDLDGELITTITSTTKTWLVSTEDGQTREIERSTTDEQTDTTLIAEAVAAYQAAAQRFTQDGQYIELNTSNRAAPVTGSDSVETDGDDDIDLDGEDTDELPELAPIAPLQPDIQEQDTFEEGNNTPDFQDFDVTLNTQEDAQGTDLAGQLPSGQSNGVFAVETLPANGTLILGPNGSFSYQPDPDFNGADAFVYSVTGPNGFERGTVTVNVTPVNDAPVFEDVAVQGIEDTIILGTALATDIDGDELSYTLDQGASFGNVVVTRDGAWSYTPDPNFEGTDTFRILVSDAEEATDTQTVTVIVAGQNDAPFITNSAEDAAGAVTENAGFIASNQLTAIDVDSNAAPVWSGGGTGQFGTFEINNSGNWAYLLDARAEALQQGQVVTEEFVATVTDDQGASRTQVVTVTVTGTNDQPTVAPIFATTTTGIALSGQLTAQDPDADPTFTFSADAFSAMGGVISLTGDTYEYTPAANFFGEDSFTYTVTDEFGAQASALINVVVVSPIVTVLDDQTIEFQVATNVEDGAIGSIQSTVTLNDENGEATPAQILNWSIDLTADGAAFGTIAFLTGNLLSDEGRVATLNLADINGIENLLGTQNTITAAAEYALDGSQTAGLELITTGTLGKQDTAQNEAGSAQGDLIYGSDSADVLGGSTGTDLIFAFAGDDTLFTDGGLDHLFAGAGDDLINLSNLDAISTAQVTEIDGGTGRDRLAFLEAGNANDALDLIDLSGIEALDIDNGLTNTLDLSIADLLGLSNEADTELETLLDAALGDSATIYGDTADQVNLLADADGQFVDTNTSVTDENGTILNVYQYVGGGDVLATLAVDSDVSVTTNAQPSS